MVPNKKPKKRSAGTVLLKMLKVVRGLQHQMGKRSQQYATPGDAVPPRTTKTPSPAARPNPSEVLAPPSQPAVAPDHTLIDEVWTRVRALGSLSEADLELLTNQHYWQQVRERISILLSDDSQPMRAVVLGTLDFCQTLTQARRATAASEPSAVAGSEALPIILSREQEQWVDKVLLAMRQASVIDKARLDTIMRDPRFSQVESFIASCPVLKDAIKFFQQHFMNIPRVPTSYTRGGGEIVS